MPSVDLCVLCGDPERRVIVIRDAKRVYLSACGLCLLAAFDELTGYHFTKMFHQYEALKQFHAAKRAERKKGVTSPAKGERFATVLSRQAARDAEERGL